MAGGLLLLPGSIMQQEVARCSLRDDSRHKRPVLRLRRRHLQHRQQRQRRQQLLLLGSCLAAPSCSSCCSTSSSNRLQPMLLTGLLLLLGVTNSNSSSRCCSSREVVSRCSCSSVPHSHSSGSRLPQCMDLQAQWQQQGSQVVLERGLLSKLVWQLLVLVLLHVLLDPHSRQLLLQLLLPRLLLLLLDSR